METVWRFKLSQPACSCSCRKRWTIQKLTYPRWGVGNKSLRRHPALDATSLMQKKTTAVMQHNFILVVVSRGLIIQTILTAVWNTLRISSNSLGEPFLLIVVIINNFLRLLFSWCTETKPQISELHFQNRKTHIVHMDNQSLLAHLILQWLSQKNDKALN